MGLLAAAVLGVAAAALPMVAGASPLLGAPALAAACVAGWAALWPRRPMAALAAMPLFTAALLGWELPRAAPLWLAPQVEHALAAAGLAGRPLAAVGFHEPSLMVLAGTATIMSPTGADGADALAAGRAGAAAVAERDEASFQGEAARLGLHLRAFATLRGFNYSRGRQTNLTLYGPSTAGR